MSNTNPTMSLRDSISAHLESAGEATQAQITKAVGMADFPSRVIKELNAMRTDALIEAERRGKGPELTYWLVAIDTPQDRRPEPAPPAATSTPPAEPTRGKQDRRIALQAIIQGRTLADAIATRDAAATLGCTPEGVLWILRHEEAVGRAKRLHEKDGKRGLWIYDPRTTPHTQPAEVKITGSSASVSTPLSEGAAVQPNPAPVQLADVSPAAPVAADVKPKSRFNQGPRDRAASDATSSAPRAASTPPPPVQPDEGLLHIISKIRDAIGDQSSMLSELPDRIRTLWAMMEQQAKNLDCIHALLADRVCGGIDPSDLGEVECAERAARMIDDLIAEIPQRDAELRNQKALVEKIEHLLQSARNEAEHLRRHAGQDAADMVNHPPHYQGKVECIDAIEAALGPDGFAAYCRGNAIKYSFRAGRKGPCAEDLAKAQWYLARATAPTSVTPIAA